MKVRIDFGRVLPGILLAVAGLVLVAILLIVAVIAFLFSFLGLGGVATVALELLLIPAVFIAAGVITVLTGVSWWSKEGEGWFSGWAGRRALKDRMRISERTGEVFGVAISLVIFLFLYENQTHGAAFFTSSFGSTAEFFFYGPLFVGVVLSLARAMYGHRNAIRPFDSLGALFLAAASFWLLSAFPFDFSRFGELFPSSIQFIFGWLSDDIGRILFTLAGVAALANSVYTAFLYSSVRGHLGSQIGPQSAS